MRIASATLDACFSIRPVLLIPVWGFAAFGAARAQLLVSKQPAKLWAAVPASIFPPVLLFSLSVAAVYVINQIADREVDKRNGGKPLIASGVVGLKTSICLAILLGAVSVVIPCIQFNWILALLSAAALILGLLYSCRPSFFSGRPVADFLSNALGYGVIAFGAGWHSAGANLLSGEFIVAALPYFLLMCAGSISSTVPDVCGDKQEGKRTTAVALGVVRSQSVAAGLLLLALYAGHANHDTHAVICAMLSIPAYAFYFVSRHPLAAEATYKAGGAAAMLISGALMPIMIPASLLVFTATWLYFRLRHGVSYPSLAPARATTV